MPLLISLSIPLLGQFKLVVQQKKNLFIATALFLISGLVSSYLSNSLHLGIWSNLERMQGLINYFYLFILFILLLTFFTEVHWKYWFSIHIIFAVISCFIEIYHNLNTPMGSTNKYIPLEYLFGNRSYYSSYLFYSLLFSLLLLQHYFPERKHKMFLYGTTLFLLLNILIARNRASLIALSVAFAIVYSTSLFNYKNFIQFKKIKVLLIGIIISFSFFIISTEQGQIFRNYITDPSTLIRRLDLWEIAVKNFTQNPITGSGIGQFSKAFNHYYPPHYHKNEDWVDNTHNLFLEILSSMGLLGISLFFLIIYFYVRNLKSNQKIIFFILIAIVIKQLFIIEPLETLILFFSICAYLIKEPTKFNVTEPSNIVQFISIMMFIVASFFAYESVVKEYQYAKTNVQLTYKRDNTSGLNLDAIRNLLNKDSLYLADHKQGLLIFALESFSKRKINRNELRSLYYMLAPSINETTNQLHNPVPYLIGISQLHSLLGDHKHALKYIEEALRVSPTRAKTYIIRGVLFLRMNLPNLALLDFKKAQSLDPTYSKSTSLIEKIQKRTLDKPGQP